MMTRMFLKRAAPLAFALAGAGAALMATTSAADDRGRGRGVEPGQCVSRPLDATRIVDRSTLYVDDYQGHAVLLHMASQCLNQFHDAVGLTFRGAERICDPMDVDVTDSVMTEMPVPCIVDSVEALNKDQAKVYRNGK